MPELRRHGPDGGWRDAAVQEGQTAAYPLGHAHGTPLDRGLGGGPRRAPRGAPRPAQEDRLGTTTPLTGRAPSPSPARPVALFGSARLAILLDHLAAYDA